MARADDCKKIARYLVVIINIIFLGFGLTIMIVGFYGYNKSDQIESSASIFKALNVKLIAALITCTGIGTIVISVCGCAGAYFKNTNVLKIYAVTLFMVCAVQLGMGAYMVTLDPSDLRNEWETDTSQGEARRQSYQDYMKCCGFEYITDSTPETPCDGNYHISCKDATLNFMHKYLGPVAVIAVVIAVIELTSLVATCIILATSKKKEDFYDNPFGY